MKQEIFLLIFIIISLFIHSCNTTDPPENGNGQDTTSHYFTFQSWTFGEHSSSVLYDVAIIDENNIWAVGEIYMNDSLGQPNPILYNVVHWDGIEWKSQKVEVEFRRNNIIPPLEGIFAFSNNDIWLVGSLPIYGDGNSWTMYDLRTTLDPNISLSRVLGVSSSEIYFVGRAGSIAQFNGTSWQKIEGGTDVDIHDIWGNIDSETSEQTILAIASFQNYGFGMDLLKIDGLSASKLDTTGLRIAQSSVWFTGDKNIYVVGDGVFFKNNLSDARWQQYETHLLLFKRRIRGSDWNNVFILGDFGVVSHYNGKTWHHYRGNELPNLNGSYYSVSFDGNTIVAVGDLDNGQAIILRGDR